MPRAAPRISFKLTILVLFAALTISLSAAVLYVNYVRNSDAVFDAASDLLEQVAGKALGETDLLIAPFYELAEIITVLPPANIDPGSGDLARPVVNVMRAALDRFPQMASIYVANREGEFFRIASFKGDRSLARDFLRAPPAASFAVQSIVSTTAKDRLTSWRFLNNAHLEISSRTDEQTTYDPRTRPWYTAARTTNQAIVTDYYVFASVPSIGLTIARAFNDDNGTVFGADLTLSSASKFLAAIRAKELAGRSNAEIALFTVDGQLLAHSDPDAYERFINNTATPRIPMAGDIGSAALSQAVSLYKSSKRSELSFDDETGLRWIARVLPLSPAFGPDAHLAVVVPFDDFLGPLAKTARETLMVSILIVLIFLPIVYLAANAISAPLARLTGEIAELRNLDGKVREKGGVNSAIAEIQDLASALATSKFMLGAFGKYVPKSLVQQMIDSGVEPAIAGDRRQVTVFFSDVKDFTTMSEELPPERLMELTSEYLEGLVDIILRNRGTVDKFVGDQIMAFWNAPNLNDQHPVDACLAILRCRDWSNARNAQWEKEGHPIFYTRFALHMGDVVAGNVGSSDRMDYTVVGNTINLGSRLEGLNKIYSTQVLISDPVAAFVKGKFVMRPIDKVLPKGAVFPLGLYELVGAHPDWADAPADLLVGRDKVRFCERWSEVYERYLKRDWNDLSQAIEDFTAEFGDDPVAQLYYDRVMNFTIEPPPDDWDGVIRYSEK